MARQVSNTVQDPRVSTQVQPTTPGGSGKYGNPPDLRGAAYGYVAPDGQVIHSGENTGLQFRNVYDPTTGHARSGAGAYELNQAPFDPNSLDAFQSLKGQVLGTEQTPWTKMMLEKQGQEQQAALGQANQSALAGQQQALSGLAMRGGYTSGARERLAQAGAQGTMEARQDIAGKGIAQRQDILTQSEAQRQDLLPKLAQAEADLALKARAATTAEEQYNIQNRLQELRDLRAHEQFLWLKDKDAKAAAQLAAATAAAGGGGGNNATLGLLSGGLSTAFGG